MVVEKKRKGGGGRVGQGMAQVKKVLPMQNSIFLAIRCY